MKSLLRSAGVVLAAYIAIGVLVVLTDLAVGTMMPGDWKPGRPVPSTYFLVSLITAPFYSCFGGWLAARLAPEWPMAHAWGLVGFGELMGVVSMAMSKGAAPLWYSLALLALFPPCVLLGAKWKRRQETTCLSRSAKFSPDSVQS